MLVLIAVTNSLVLPEVNKMTAIKGVAFMGSSTVLRIIGGLLTFSILARALGPEDFGQLMLWFSVATLVGFVANYGLTPYMLRELTLNKHAAANLIGEVLVAKILIYISLLCVVVPCALIIIDSSHQYVFLILVIGVLFESMTEYLNTGYRAMNRFSTETKIATYAVVLQLLLVSVAVYWQTSILSAAVAISLSRLLVSAITWHDQSKYLNGIKMGALESGIKHIKAAFAYAADFFLQSLMGQVDSILLNQMLGISAVGIYQAGMKVFQGCSQTANVLANVFIPRLTSANNENERKKVQLAFVSVGAVLGLLMVVGADIITQVIYGEQYTTLYELFPWFGLLFFVRFFAASYGVVLTSAGLQAYRTNANIALWVTVLVAAYYLVPRYEIQGWLFSLIIGNGLLSLMYLLRVSIQFKLSYESIALSIVSLLSFYIFMSSL